MSPYSMDYVRRQLRVCIYARVSTEHEAQISALESQLDMDTIFHIMTQPKANQQEKISFKVAELRDFFPRHYTAAQMMQEIKVALKERQQRLARQRDHSR